MKIKYIGETVPLELTQNKIYDVISVEKNWYRIIIDEPIEDDYLYPPHLFEAVENDGTNNSEKTVYGKNQSGKLQPDFAANIAVAGK